MVVFADKHDMASHQYIIVEDHLCHDLTVWTKLHVVPNANPWTLKRGAVHHADKALVINTATIFDMEDEPRADNAGQITEGKDAARSACRIVVIYLQHGGGYLSVLLEMNLLRTNEGKQVLIDYIKGFYHSILLRAILIDKGYLVGKFFSEILL